MQNHQITGTNGVARIGDVYPIYKRIEKVLWVSVTVWFSQGCVIDCYIREGDARSYLELSRCEWKSEII